jgi:transketolase
LAKEGIKARVVSMHTVKPIDRAAIISAAKDTGAIVTVEEHNIYGGLGGAVAEVLAEEGLGIRFKMLALPDIYVHDFGTHDWLLDRYGFSPDGIASTAKGLIG